MSEEKSTHRLFAFVVAVALIAAVVAFAASMRAYPPWLSAALVALVLAVVVSENYLLEFGRGSISLGFPLTIAAVVLLGPTNAALVSAAGAISVAEIRRGKPWSAQLYNLSSFVLVTLASGWAYLLAGGRVLLGPAGASPLNSSDMPAALLSLTVVAVVSVLGNVLFTSVGLVLIHGIRFRELLPQLAVVAPNEFALAFVGFLIAQVLAISVLGLLLFVAPLVVARQVYQRYIQLREAYADVVRSLIGVLEAKDPYTRGHSERVAGYSIALAEQMQLDPATAQRLEYAALLHDLGKIAIARSILVKPDRLTNVEYQAIKEHPNRGAEIVARIPSLGDIVPYVRSHHEWFDGNGYCDGLAGDEIPLLSRVMSVADAFDAMTTARPYRPAKSPEAAVDELVRMSGSQFDPDLVLRFVHSEAPYLYSPERLNRAARERATEQGRV